MEVLIILVPLSVLILLVAVWLLFKMITSGQLQESEGAAWRILMDNDTTATHASPDDPPRQ